MINSEGEPEGDRRGPVEAPGDRVRADWWALPAADPSRGLS